MTTSEGTQQANGAMLDDVVKQAGEYYTQIRSRHVNETRLDVGVVSIVAWFASLFVVGISWIGIWGFSTVTIPLVEIFALIATMTAILAGIVTFRIKRNRQFRFAELGDMIGKMKDQNVTSEDGLRLMDAMHQARLMVKKRRLDSAVEYALIAFVLVGLLGSNGALGLLAGVIVYLYFRREAMREYEREEDRYETSKRDLLQSL